MDKRWEKVVVLGAAGKMGSGIALLLLMEMAWRERGVLTLVDVNEEAFSGLKRYLRDQIKRHAERCVNRLRERYVSRKDLVDNGEMIEAFVLEAMDKARCVTSLEECRGAGMVFEAIIEDVALKSKVLSEIDTISGGKAWYFSNTSSIPIKVLGNAAAVNSRIAGFHFYNPPAVQKLMEIIYPEDAGADLKAAAVAIGKELGKTIVFSNDIAGFIGNGHFIREIMGACTRTEALAGAKGIVEAICTVDYVTREYLVRPMGIFQLIDFVGIDVCVHIGKVMEKYLNGEKFVPKLLEKMLALGVKGGQKADGGQKEGFFRYDKGKPVAVYDVEKGDYVPCTILDEFKTLPASHLPWKEMSKRADKAELLDKYFRDMGSERTAGTQMAWSVLEESRKIAYRLVDDGVCGGISDVDTVLECGFYHLYGVDAPFKRKGA